MPKRIPIKAAREFAKQYGLSHVIILAHDGELDHVVTYGKSKKNCIEAAEFGNKLKRALGWPEELCNDVPSRAKR